MSLNLQEKSYIDDEPAFRYDFNKDPMAVEKLSQGIRSFDTDTVTLKEILRGKPTVLFPLGEVIVLNLW